MKNFLFNKLSDYLKKIFLSWNTKILKYGWMELQKVSKIKIKTDNKKIKDYLKY